MFHKLINKVKNSRPSSETPATGNAAEKVPHIPVHGTGGEYGAQPAYGSQPAHGAPHVDGAFNAQGAPPAHGALAREPDAGAGAAHMTQTPPAAAGTMPIPDGSQGAPVMGAAAPAGAAAAPAPPPPEPVPEPTAPARPTPQPVPDMPGSATPKYAPVSGSGGERIPAPSCHSFDLSGLPVNVYGLDSLRPVGHGSKPHVCIAVHMHGRTGSARHEGDLAMQIWKNTMRDRSKLRNNRVRDFLLVTFDQRNHGARKTNPKGQKSWKEGNPTHGCVAAASFFTYSVLTCTA